MLNLENGQVSTMSKINMKFNYRDSILKQNNNKYFLIKAKFDLSKKIEKYNNYIDNIDFRKNKQPE
jgi:UDP-N-acetylenolpyruvoylglucosamine reductase